MTDQVGSEDHRVPSAGAPVRKADLHVHSSFSFDVPKLPAFAPLALYRRAVEVGMDFFALTDHDTLAGVEALRCDLQTAYGDHPPIPLIPGVELKVLDPSIGHTIHINVLGLGRGHLDALMQRCSSVGRFLAYCRRQGLFCVYNHPFWFEHGELPDFDAIERLVSRFPVVELNAGRIRELNERTAELARKYDRPLIAASDTHTGQVGKACTLAPGETPQAYLGNITRGLGEPVTTHFDLHGFLREIHETIDVHLRRAPAQDESASAMLSTMGIYRIMQRILCSPGLLQTAFARRGVARLLKVIARAPAHLFLRRQRRMLVRLSASGYAWSSKEP